MKPIIITEIHTGDGYYSKRHELIGKAFNSYSPLLLNKGKRMTGYYTAWLYNESGFSNYLIGFKFSYANFNLKII